MEIYFPQNIFTDLIKKSMSEETASNIKFLPSSLITNEILKVPNSIGLIPTLDLIKHRELYVSRLFGVSFEESLCNSYLYYDSEKRTMNELNLFGDISSNEAIGAKLIFKELYGTDVQINLSTGNNKITKKNILAVGDSNFENDKYLKGVSFAEEIIEVLSLPYVNYVLASTTHDQIHNFHKHINDVQSKIYEHVENENYSINLSEEVKQMLKENIPSFVCILDEQDVDGINQLLRLPFFHKIIPDIIEVKYI